MSTSVIEFGSQIEGPDAARVVLPYIYALRRASSKMNLRGFAFKKLSFLLRVDGEFGSFGISGLDKISIGRNHRYLSVDIGVSVEDRERIAEVLTDAILDTPQYLQNQKRCRKYEIDFAELESCLGSLCDLFKQEIKQL